MSLEPIAIGTAVISTSTYARESSSDGGVLRDIHRFQATRLLWILVFLLAACLWTRQINRPVDLPSWHEVDSSSVARNFFREGGNLLYPRIDWRRDGPGFVEMEFPIQPWVTAQLYRVFGIHEIIGRFLPLAAMLCALLAFCRFACDLLPPPAAWAAALFFLANRETIAMASALQPEALMLLFYVLAAREFVVWMDKGGTWHYFVALLAFSAAVLAKVPAAHLGIFFLFWAVKKDGVRAFRRPSLWFFAGVSLLPAVLWHAHARSLWLTYHNSMGVSNEDPWMGLDMLRRPRQWLNLAAMEAIFVFGVAGLLAAAFGLWANKASKAAQVGLVWFAAIGIYYLVIFRTAAGHWAGYYHIVAVPAAALLFGAAVELLVKKKHSWRAAVWGLSASIVLAVGLNAASRRDWREFPAVFQELLAVRVDFVSYLILVAASSLALVAVLKWPRLNTSASQHGGLSRLGLALLCGAFCGYFVASGQMALGLWSQFANRSPEFRCASCFSGQIPPGELIVASGGPCVDAGGHAMAQDEPEMFYFLDRKGFSTCEGKQSVAELRHFADRGARFFVASKYTVQEQPGLETALKQNFSLRGECASAWLFKF